MANMATVWRAVGETPAGAVEVGPSGSDSESALEYGRGQLEDGLWVSFTVEERHTLTLLPIPHRGPVPHPERPEVVGRGRGDGVEGGVDVDWVPPPFSRLPEDILPPELFE